MAKALYVPELYSDLEKNYGTGSDFWKKNYPENLNSEFKFKPVFRGLTPTVTFAATDKGVVGSLKVAYPFFRGTELNVTTDTNKGLKIDITDRNSITPGLKATVGTDTKDVAIDAEYKHQLFALSAGYSGLSSLVGSSSTSSLLRGSLVFGVFGASLGLNATYNLHNGAIATKAIATETIGNTTATFFTGVNPTALTSGFASPFYNFGASLLVRANDKVTFASKIEDAFGGKPILTVGGAYDVDATTQVKGKLDTNNHLGLSVSRQFSYAKATASVAVDTQHNTIGNYGFALNLNN